MDESGRKDKDAIAKDHSKDHGAQKDLPACGLFRTTRPVGGIPQGRLVFFHNHGDPGPGIYLPSGWLHNRAEFSPQGHTLKLPEDLASIEAMAPEGLYRVTESFFCCDKKCVEFQPEQLVQLGYNGAAQPLLFVPSWTGGLLNIPENGTRVDPHTLKQLTQLLVAESDEDFDEEDEELDSDSQLLH